MKQKTKTVPIEFVVDDIKCKIKITVRLCDDRDFSPGGRFFVTGMEITSYDIERQPKTCKPSLNYRS